MQAGPKSCLNASLSCHALSAAAQITAGSKTRIFYPRYLFTLGQLCRHGAAFLDVKPEVSGRGEGVEGGSWGGREGGSTGERSVRRR